MRDAYMRWTALFGCSDVDRTMSIVRCGVESFGCKLDRPASMAAPAPSEASLNK